MNGQQGRLEIEAWEAKGALFEKYSYAPSKVEPLPSHVHAEYQFALSFTSIGEYSYRGGKLKIPTGNLCVLHSGEAHAPSDAREVVKSAVYWMLYAEPSELSNIYIKFPSDFDKQSETAGKYIIVYHVNGVKLSQHNFRFVP